MNGKPLVSIVILAWNELAYTRECLESLLRYTDHPFELILVDNGSTDGTGEYFSSLAGATVIRNDTNLGFPRGVNQGIRAARGDLILLLNNDTVLTPNWLSNLVACAMSDERIGMVGPRSNYVAGRQFLATHYGNIEQMLAFAREFNHPAPGRWFELDLLIGFCLLIKREVFEQIGFFDEQFGTGNFEDNDFSLRARQAGYRLVCAGDTFVHHYGSRSFTANGVNHNQLMRQNRELFQRKWKAPLSACIAVDDQDEGLAQTIASLRGLADEIVVAAAGPAERFAAVQADPRVRLELTGDGGLELRNRALARATQPWVLLLEAGETIAADDLDALRLLLVNPPDTGYYLYVSSPIGLRRGAPSIHTYSLRLFARRPGLRLQTWRDEDLQADLVSQGGTVALLPLRIRHGGYSPPTRRTRQPAFQQAEAMLTRLLETPADRLLHFRAGVALARYGRRETAIEEFKAAFTGLASFSPPFVAPLLTNLATLAADLGLFAQARSIVEQGLGVFTDHPELLALASQLKPAQREGKDPHD